MKAFCSTLPFLGFISILFGQPGQLDATFNTTGHVTTHIAGYNVDNSGLLIQEDGKILVCGTAETATNARDMVIARYNSNGLLDSSFNQSGILVIDVLGKIDYCYAMALQQDGKILLTGIATLLTNERKTVIIRLLEDGSFDDTFGNNGMAFNLPDHNAENPKAIMSLADGKIIVTGSIEANLICAVFKYNDDGTSDQNFGIQGLAMATVPGGYNPSFGTVQPDGKIITGGFLLGLNTEIIMVRFSPQGIIDSTFGTNGIVQTAYPNETHFGYSIILQPDHKILMVDGITHGTKRDFCMLRYTENGDLDSTFGSNGRVVTAMSGVSNTAHAISLQDDQKILLAGFSGIKPHHDIAIARYNSNGSLDLDFGASGKVISDFGLDDLAFTMAIQADKKIVVAGFSIDNTENSDFVVARYWSGLETVGTKDALSEIHHVILYPNPVRKETTLKYFLPVDQSMTIRLYNLSGQLIQNFFENKQRGQGEHQEKLILKSDLPTGTYTLVLETKNSKTPVSFILR